MGAVTVQGPYIPDAAPAGCPPLDKAYPHGIKSMSKGTTMYDALRRLGESFEEVPLVGGKSGFVRPGSVLYTFDGKQKRWDVVENHPSVGIVLFHTQLKCFLLVRQFRPPVYATLLRHAKAAGLPAPSKAEGFTYELCAGLVDKEKSLEQIAKEEVFEEVGYDVDVKQLISLGNSVASAGTSGSLHHMYLALVDDSMRVEGAGGGLQDHAECIEVLALPLEHAPAWVLDTALPKSPGAQFGVTWTYHALRTGHLKLAPSSYADQQQEQQRGLETEELVLRPVLPS